MRKKKCILTFQPTMKNKVYLERLGFIDGRSGKKRKGDNKSISECINQCLTTVFESKASQYNNMANNEELTEAWICFQIQELSRKNDAIINEMKILQYKRPMKQTIEVSGCEVN